METKENNNTASTHQEKARKLKKLRRWQIVVSLLGISLSGELFKWSASF